MHLITDLHIHSKYSYAVSKTMDLYEIATWAHKKGIQLISTGDWQHPRWFKTISSELKEVSDGIYALRNPSSQPLKTVRFFLGTEVSCIYSHLGKGRRIHFLLWSPSLDVSQKIIRELEKRGARLDSNGRPIIGLSSKHLLTLILDIDPRCMLIPAHVWTPWYGLFGSRSGYNSLQECFEELTPQIHAIESGLSSDPRMNWPVKELTNRTILSFSDAHSGAKIGREATVFESNKNHKNITLDDLTYDDITMAVKKDTKGRLSIAYTIEFFPEEGKYHWDGHRNCNYKQSPYRTIQEGPLCPRCNKPLTIGVHYRTLQLGSVQSHPENHYEITQGTGSIYIQDPEYRHPPFVSIIPLLDILVEIHGHSLTKGKRAYEELISNFSSEFDILLAQPYEAIQKKSTARLAAAIKTVRERTIQVDPGFDGVFGNITVA